MNIGSVSRGATVERLRSVGAPGHEVSQPRSVADTSVDGQGVKVSLSKPVQMLSQLEDLKRNDPEAFEQTLSDSSAQLRRAAEESKGPSSANLSELATRFAHAAATGDISTLQQPPPVKPHSAREVSGHAGRALSAYAKHTPVRARADESVERAMGAAFARIEQATRAASSGAQQSAIGSNLYA